MIGSNWKKVGWRSVKHLGIPKMVVRFAANGSGKMKLLDAGNIDYSMDHLRHLVIEAEEHWASLKEVGK